MSNTAWRRLCSRSTRSSASASVRPSPICMRSAVVRVRADELMTQVRSALAMPLPIWRVVSSSSDDTSASSVPGTGFRLNTGLRPPSCVSGTGWTSM